MNILSDDEAFMWLEQRKVRPIMPSRKDGREGAILLPEGNRWLSFETPSDSYSQVLLAREIVKAFEQQPFLIWITSWALYQDAEMDFIDGFRQSFGETRRLIDAPGYLLNNTESRINEWEAYPVVVSAISFTWEGYIVSEDGELIIWLGDKIFDVFIADEERLRRLRDAFNVWSEPNL